MTVVVFKVRSPTFIKLISSPASTVEGSEILPFPHHLQSFEVFLYLLLACIDLSYLEFIWTVGLGFQSSCFFDALVT